MAQDRAERGIDAARVEQVVRDAVKRRPERTEVRVDRKSAAELVFDLAMLGVPIALLGVLEGKQVGKADRLSFDVFSGVAFAVEEVRFGPGAAAGEDGVAFGG